MNLPSCSRCSSATPRRVRFQWRVGESDVLFNRKYSLSRLFTYSRTPARHRYNTPYIRPELTSGQPSKWTAHIIPLSLRTQPSNHPHSLSRSDDHADSAICRPSRAAQFRHFPPSSPQCQYRYLIHPGPQQGHRHELDSPSAGPARWPLPNKASFTCRTQQQTCTFNPLSAHAETSADMPNSLRKTIMHG